MSDITNTVANPFDFINTDWIADKELAAKVAGESAEKVQKCIEVFKHPAYAGYARPLDINQFRASYEGIFGPGSAPSSATLRTYLNKGVEEGVLCKPTRQTYGLTGVTVMPGAPAEDGPKAEPAEDPAATDPLGF